MSPIEFLTRFLMKLFLGNPARPTAGKTDADSEATQMGSEAVETRCVNPDIGCPFEVS
jgi:hypothetical protein